MCALPCAVVPVLRGAVVGSDVALQCCAVDARMGLRGVASADRHLMMHAVYADRYRGSPSAAAGLQYAVGESQYVVHVARCSRVCASQYHRDGVVQR